MALLAPCLPEQVVEATERLSVLKLISELIEHFGEVYIQCELMKAGVTQRIDELCYS
jgi:aromatic ring hydroxylase